MYLNNQTDKLVPMAIVENSENVKVSKEKLRLGVNFITY